jgi:DNA-binding NtrC family response regulator
MSLAPRILLVDDEIAPMRALRYELKGFDVVMATSLPEALRLLDLHDFDAVVSDWNLGTARASVLLDAARRRQAKSRRIIVSGEVPEELAPLLISGTAHRYIAKPWLPHDVRHALLEELAAA